MKKKLIIAIAAAGTALAMLPLFAAFEAHVINVTATIENALNVPISSLSFGTIFPQEHLNLPPFDIQLSESFKNEPRVDDVNYRIRQKPKCAITKDNGQTLVGPTATGEVVPDQSQQQGYHVDRGPAPRQLTGEETWGVLPSLCPYLSKTPDGRNDYGLPSFHIPFTIVGGQVVWNDGAHGHLAKSEENTDDTWTIDVAAPCFIGQCAQDWASFVHGINPDAGDPNQYTQPASNEHKLFGCDLWIEATAISTTDLDVSSCGIVQTPFPPSGEMLSPADYSYAGPDLGNTTAGNAADHKWIHATGTNRVVWDMGTPTQSAFMIPSVDHLPFPAESHEATLFGSDNPTGPWEQGIEVQTYSAGPSSLISDDDTTRWTFTKPYRYVSALAGGTLQNDGDAEIDAVCSAKTQ